MRIRPDVEERARERQIAAQNNDRGEALRSSGQLSQTEGRTRDEVAAVVGLGSGRTFERGAETVAWAYSNAAVGAASTSRSSAAGVPAGVEVRAASPPRSGASSEPPPAGCPNARSRWAAPASGA